MKLVNNIKEYLFDKKYYILLYDQSVFLFGLKRIIYVEDCLIKVEFDDFTVSIKGDNLTIEISYDNELLIKGNIYEIQK